MILKGLAFTLGVSLIAGCSLVEKEQPVNYYVLDTQPVAPGKTAKTTATMVSIVELPEYLDQPNIVLRDASQRLHVAYYHSWAEDLASAIRRVLISELNRADSAIRFTMRCENCAQLNIVIDHFYPTTQGEVVLAGEYQVINADRLLFSEVFLIKTALAEDGYEHAVQQMRNAIIRLARDINGKIALQKTIRPRAQGDGDLDANNKAIGQEVDASVANTQPVKRIRLKTSAN